MKIKIKKCSTDGAWYQNRIGQVFEVLDNGGETGKHYGVMIDSFVKSIKDEN